jgi:hypothetical protein
MWNSASTKEAWGLASGSMYLQSVATAGGDVGNIEFFNGRSGAGTSTMKLTGDNRVGIGTTAPTTKLDVNGTINAVNYTGNGSQLTSVNGNSSGLILNWNASGFIVNQSPNLTDYAKYQYGSNNFNGSGTIKTAGVNVTHPGSEVNGVYIGNDGIIRMYGSSPSLTYYKNNSIDDDNNIYFKNYINAITKQVYFQNGYSASGLEEGISNSIVYDVRGSGAYISYYSPNITLNGLLKMYPMADTTSSIRFLKADGTTMVMSLDTTNARVGIGTTAPAYKLDVNGTGRFNGSLNVTGNINATGTITGGNTNFKNITSTHQTVTGNVNVTGNINATGNLNLQNITALSINATSYKSGTATGISVTYQVVCDVDLIGLTKKYQNFTYTSGLLTSNTTCA